MSRTRRNPPAEPGADGTMRRFSPRLRRGIALLFALTLCLGCGKPTAADRAIAPDKVLDFKALFAQNCAGCHGADGQFGPAPPLNDPLLFAYIPADVVQNVITQGRPGTLMPAFDQEHGGPLTNEQINVLAKGLPKAWPQPPFKPTAIPLPDYYFDNPVNRSLTAGNAESGNDLFNRRCATCHGKDGNGGKEAGPLNDPAFMDLLSDLALRRLIVTGRPDLKMPGGPYILKDAYDSQGSMDDSIPTTPQQLSDLVAYLASMRSSKPSTANVSSTAK